MGLRRLIYFLLYLIPVFMKSVELKFENVTSLDERRRFEKFQVNPFLGKETRGQKPSSILQNFTIITGNINKIQNM